MIAVLLQGGIGNQMFEYATAFSFAKKHGHDLILSKTNLLINKNDYFRLNQLSITCNEDALIKLSARVQFVISNRYIRRMLKISKIGKLKIGKWIYVTQIGTQYCEGLVVNSDVNVLLDGYWQNPVFFQAYREQIIREFRPSFQLSPKCQKYADTLSTCESVSLHIRRGDYLKAENSKYLIRDDYYLKAIQFILQKKPDAKFYIFSDDKDWSKLHFPGFSIVELDDNNANADIEEMYLMSLCKNNVNANSTFSWWGAYMNTCPDKIVISPERPWNPGMIPNEWYVAQNTGRNCRQDIAFVQRQ